VNPEPPKPYKLWGYVRTELRWLEPDCERAMAIWRKFHVKHLDTMQIAERYKMPEATVYNTLHHCRERYRLRLVQAARLPAANC